MNKHRYYQMPDDRQTSTNCPRCGQPVKTGAAFCGHCGYRLTGSDTQLSTDGETTETSGAGQQPSRRQPQKSGSKWKAYAIILVIVILGGTYWFGREYYAPSNQLKRTVLDLKNGRKDIAKQFTSLDPSLKLTDATTQPLVAHFKNDRNALADFQSQLQERGATSDGLFKFQKTGKTWLVFDKYQVVVKSVYPVITTNHKNVKLMINGKQVGVSDREDYRHKFGPLVPGNYTLSASGHVSGHAIKNSGHYYIQDDNGVYSLPLETISFTTTATAGTKVYLNKSYVGTTNQAGQLKIKNFPLTNQMKLTGKYQVDGATLTSKAVTVGPGDEGSEVPVTFKNVLDKEDAENFISNLFSLISNYTDDPDADQSGTQNVTLNEMFVDGTNNKDYKEFTTMAKGYHDNKDILSVSYDPKVRSVAPGGKNLTKITYDVEYHFDNTEDERTQVFRYTATVKKSGDEAKIVQITPAKKITAEEEQDN